MDIICGILLAFVRTREVGVSSRNVVSRTFPHFSQSMLTPMELPDLGMDIFDHSENQSAAHIDGCAWTSLARLVAASSAGPTLGLNVMAVNAAAVRNGVEGLRPAVINNMLHRSREPTSDAVTRRLVADKVLAVIELLIEESYADLLVGEVGEFLR